VRSYYAEDKNEQLVYIGRERKERGDLYQTVRPSNILSGSSSESPSDVTHIFISGSKKAKGTFTDELEQKIRAGISAQTR